jgi:hypothetical protein
MLGWVWGRGYSPLGGPEENAYDVTTSYPLFRLLLNPLILLLCYAEPPSCHADLYSFTTLMLLYPVKVKILHLYSLSQ